MKKVLGWFVATVTFTTAICAGIGLIYFAVNLFVNVQSSRIPIGIVLVFTAVGYWVYLAITDDGSSFN